MSPTGRTPAAPGADPEIVAKLTGFAQQAKTCACKLVLRVFDAVSSLASGLDSGGGQPAPSPAPENPFLAAVAAWVRREVERITDIPFIAAAIRTVGERLTSFTTELTDRLTEWTFDVVQCANPTDAQQLPADLERTTVVAGLEQPTDFRFLGDGRIIIVEKAGTVKIAGGAPGTPPVVAATLPTNADREKGLVGIELDPRFEDNGYVYLFYTTAANRDRLARFTMTGDTIDLASEVVLMEAPDEAGPVHHGGEIHFGPDGKLYLATGDNSQSTNAARLDNVHGKILRLNPDGTVPEDNPFADAEVPQIFAYGLRNPFRFTFTPTGELLAGDVGDQSWEELNHIVAGGNYGWPGAEGPCPTCDSIDPVFAYAHTPPPGRAGSITAVMVYAGTALPEQYRDKVFISDYALGFIKVLTFDPTYSTVLAETTLDDEAGTPVKMIEGPDGNIYQLNIYPGELYRISAAAGNRAPTAMLTASPTSGYSPLTVEFSSAGSADPDPGTELAYAWDFGDGTSSTLANPSRTYLSNGAYTVTLTVSDGEESDTATTRIIVGSTPPEVRILTPLSESRYNAGDVISLDAQATDAEDGDLPESAYSWTVLFHHADHIHPYQTDIAGPSGTVSLSTSEHNVATTWYEFVLTVTDSSGLSTSESVEIRPNLVTLTFGSTDPGAVYTVDGIPHRGTHTEQAVVGVIRELDAPSPQTVDGVDLTWAAWSDGGPQRHTISTPAGGGSYVVTFVRANNADQVRSPQPDPVRA